MAVYFVTGKLGSGKSLCAIGKIRDYLSEGRRVATNLDLWMDGMFCYHKQPAIRLPDKPRAVDMIALGDGYEAEDERDNDESKYGLIVLDECGTWLNSREWNDKERRKLIDWFLHARKHRWDIIFLIQSIEACDSQIVQSLCEHLVICRRLDRFKLAGIKLPRLHIANVYYGKSTESRIERWTYRGTDLYQAYDTRQRFRDGIEYFDGGPVDMRAQFSYLSAWHLKGRYLPPLPEAVPFSRRLANLGKAVFFGPLILAWMLIDSDSCERQAFRAKWMEADLERRRQERAKYKTLMLAYAHDPNLYPPA